jgi:hypothetical protein
MFAHQTERVRNPSINAALNALSASAYVPLIMMYGQLLWYCRSILLIGLENYSDEQLEEIQAVAEAIAGKVVEVPSLDDLAGVWVTLIPRRNVA